jgi:hypothetical protein
MDFRIFGVFLIMVLWGLLLSKIEGYLLTCLSLRNMALVGIIAMALPHWLWYGDKNIMNALMIWLILSVLHRVRFAFAIGRSPAPANV